MSELSEHARRNQVAWTSYAPEFVADAERCWASTEPSWGLFGVPESDVRALDGIELDGADVVELGCGTAYWSAWFARRGASPVGVDITAAQLDTARRLQELHGIEFPLLHEPNRPRCRTRRSTSRSRSTGPASGAIPSGGFPRRRACSARVGGWSFSSTGRS